jgi:hypothetical protein
VIRSLIVVAIGISLLTYGFDDADAKGRRSATTRAEATRSTGSSGTAYRAMSSATSFRNCSEARAAGAAPVRSGAPGYSRKLDRDGDGVWCER